MKRQKSQPLLTQFGFKQQRKEIAGMGELLLTRLLHRDTFIYSIFFGKSVTHVTRHFYSLCKQTARFSRLSLIKDNSSIKSFVVYS